MGKKLETNDIQKEGKKLLTEFKEFLNQGNIVDMAVGVIIGQAFGKIVTSLVNDMLMPVIGMIIGGINFSELSVKIGSAQIMYGTFIQNIIDFLIIAACVFCFVKIINKITNINKKEEEDAKKEEVSLEDKKYQTLLEIKNLLEKQESNK